MPYIQNPDLKTFAPDGWKGTPLNSQDRFVNLHTLFRYSFLDVLKWQTTINPYKKEKRASTWRLEVKKNEDFLDNQVNSITWLGHASFLMCLGGKRLLIDPILYPLPMMKKFSELPCSPEKFKDIDYLLISHNHRDHADEQSIKLISSQNPRMQVLTGLKNDILLTPWLNKQPIQTAGWYQQFNDTANLKIYYLPTRHWAIRYTWDLNKMLWGAFVIQYQDITIYFGGDSGYDQHFKEAASLFPNIDYAILGIGAYEPRWFMRQSHTAPDEAVQAFHDLKAKTMIPMHYGTFDLADEPLHKPLEILKNLEEENKIQRNLRVLNVGEAFII